MKELHEALLDLKASPLKGDAICASVISRLESRYVSEAMKVIYKAFTEWPSYSGNIRYPVVELDTPQAREALAEGTPPERLACVQYYEAPSFWSGPYGKKRRELLDFLIERTKEFHEHAD